MKITDLFESTSIQHYDRVVDSRYFKDHVAPNLQANNSFEELAQNISTALLYHGSESAYPEGVVRFEYRQAPRDTAFYSHTKVNQLASEKIGEPVRRLLFAMNNPLHIKKYTGENEYRVLFPLGEYRMFYNPNIKDFTIDTSSASVRVPVSPQVQAAGSMFRSGMDTIEEFDLRKQDSVSKSFRSKYFGAFQPLLLEISKMLYEQGVALSKEDIRHRLKEKLGSDTPDADFQYLFKAMYEAYRQSKESMDNRLEKYVNDLKEIGGDIMNENIGHAEIMIKCEGFVFISPDDLPELIEYYFKKNSSIGLFGDDGEAQ